jgi:GT2 family glycosyltransferase
MQTKPPEPRLSVLILTRNRLAVLRNCVRSILRQQRPDFEIVILDDASDGSDTAQSIAGELADPRIRPLRSETSLGVAGGRNLLMQKATGEFLVTIDDDAVFLGEHALDEVCRAFDSQTDVGVVAFKIVDVINGQRTPLAPIGRLGNARDCSVVSKRSMVSSFRGCGHAIRKRVVEAHGDYRSDLVFAGEEWDLAYRVIQAGYKIAYEPSIEVEHFPMPTVVRKSPRRGASEVYYQFRNHAYLAYRYLPWKYALPYLGSWTVRCSIQGLRENKLLDLARGALATPRYLRGVKREVLDRNALAYLAAHGGGRGTWY